MFREMRRKNQQLTDEECIAILKQSKRGVLSLIGDGGYPYGIPVNHWYCEEDGKIYFHGAKQGHKLDSIKKCDKACFCVHDEGLKNDGEWALIFKSVVVFGRIRPVEDEQTTLRICSELTRKFTDDGEFLRKEIERSLSRVQCLELVPEHITGKRVREE